MEYDPRLLFLTLAEELDLKRAALHWGVTQRLIRSTVTRLEEEYGASLCMIENKKVTLTEAGEHLRRSLFSVGVDDDVVRLISVMQDTLSAHGVCEWMSRAASQIWPFIRIQNVKGNLRQQIYGLNSGAVDIAMIYGWPTLDHSGLTFAKLYDQETAVFLAQGTRPNSDKPSLSSMRDRTWIVPSPVVMPGIADLLAWECRKEGFSPDTFSTYQKHHFLEAVRSGTAVGFGPSNLLQTLPRELIKVPLERRATIPFGCLHRTHEASASVHRFLNLICRLTNMQAAGAEETTLAQHLSPGRLPRRFEDRASWANSTIDRVSCSYRDAQNGGNVSGQGVTNVS
jgi:Transcriptional regulator